MSTSSDLVRDTKLKTEILNDDVCVHTLYESDPRSQRRAVPRLEYWQRQKIIGRGSYGSVRLERCVKGERDVRVRAVKQLSTARFPRQQPLDYTRELEAIAKFSQPKYERCFVKAFGWYEGAESLFIAMEYLEHGDLHHYLHKSPPFSADVAGETTFQILEGLSFMHDNHFAHRDLKPANILLRSQPPDIWIKIGDFGLSKRVEDELGLTNTLKGTMGFIAPELHGFTSRTTDYAPDMWALGEITFQMLTKKPAFQNLGLLARYVHDANLFPQHDLHEHNVPDQVIGFIRSTMRTLPVDRYTADQGLKHPWISTFAPESPTPEMPETGTRLSMESVAEDLGAWTAFSAESKHTSHATKAQTALTSPPNVAALSLFTQQGTVVPRKRVFPIMLRSPSASSTSNSADQSRDPTIQDARDSIESLRRPQGVNPDGSDRSYRESHRPVIRTAAGPSSEVNINTSGKGPVAQDLSPALRAQLRARNRSMGIGDDQLPENADIEHEYLLAQNHIWAHQEATGETRQETESPAPAGVSDTPLNLPWVPSKYEHPVPFQDHASSAPSSHQLTHKPDKSRALFPNGEEEQDQEPREHQKPDFASSYLQAIAEAFYIARTVEVNGLHGSTTESDLRVQFSSFGQITDIRMFDDLRGSDEQRAFVSFPEKSAARTALTLDGANLGQMKIRVKMLSASALQDYTLQQPLPSHTLPALADTAYSLSSDMTGHGQAHANIDVNRSWGKEDTALEHYQADLPKVNDRPVATVQPVTRDLKSWWKEFRSKPSSEGPKALQQHPLHQQVSMRPPDIRSQEPLDKDEATETKGPSQIFGIDLATSIKYGRRIITMRDANGHAYTHGHIPIIVAECGAYIRQEGFYVKRLFLQDSTEVMLERLQGVFDHPPDYGARHCWGTPPASVHGAARLIARYVKSLPAPVIPFGYERNFTRIMAEEHPATVDRVQSFGQLVQKIPKPNIHLLLYLLSLFAWVAEKYNNNLVQAKDLAELFRDGIFWKRTSRQYAQAREEVSVLEFLIEHQHLLTMDFPSVI